MEFTWAPLSLPRRLLTHTHALCSAFPAQVHVNECVPASLFICSVAQRLPIDPVRTCGSTFALKFRTPESDALSVRGELMRNTFIYLFFVQPWWHLVDAAVDCVMTRASTGAVLSSATELRTGDWMKAQFWSMTMKLIKQITSFILKHTCEMSSSCVLFGSGEGGVRAHSDWLRQKLGLTCTGRLSVAGHVARCYAIHTATKQEVNPRGLRGHRGSEPLRYERLTSDVGVDWNWCIYCVCYSYLLVCFNVYCV